MRLTGPWRRLWNAASAAARVARARPTVLKVAGLEGRVDVMTSGFGVPHIYATTPHDLFFAHGYVTARDRLFQIDYNRHAAAGRLCELVGRQPLPWRDLTVHLKERTTYDVDVLVRTFGMARAAEASYDAHSALARDVLKAYAAGVNAYIATGATTLEHRILRVAPKPWRPEDSLLLIRAIGFELNFSWRSILLGALVDAAKVPSDIAELIWPNFPKGGPTIVDTQAWAKQAHELVLDRQAADSALGFGNGPGVGSNCFAVSGLHTQSGAALLANDTHLSLVAPTPWHEVRLEGGGYDLHGFALAGLPGVSIGRTPEHTWGITAGLVQDTDLYVERLDPSDATRYLTPEGYQPLSRHDEAFTVRNEGTHVRPIWSSRHGPLVETLATKPPPGERLAIAWTGHQVGRDFDSVVGLWHATSFEEVTRAVEHHVCPTFNITYAGKDGRVGYVLAGVMPKRKRGTPLRPLEGWTGEWDWDGVVPVAHNPRLFDPPQGFTVTANNRVAPENYPYELGALFEPPERFLRISGRLEALGRSITYDDLRALQLDDVSGWGLLVRDVVLRAAGGEDKLVQLERPIVARALALWLAWDGHTDKDSAGAAIGMVTGWTLGRMLVHRLAGEDAALAFLEMSSFICQPVLRLIDAAPRLEEVGIDVATLVIEAFHAAVAHCEQALGDDVGTWRWGTLHPLVARHRFHTTPLGSLFSIGPEPASGGPDTVNRGDLDGGSSFRLRVGPAMRFVASARDRDEAGTVFPGGQSGDRLSRHYDDQLPLFLRGELKPAPLSRAKVDVAMREEFWPAR